jgi:hypothetical protein
MLGNSSATGALIVLITAAASAAFAQDATDQYLQMGRTQPALAPTPSGEGHVGRLESGESVQTRFPVPDTMPLAYALNLGNVVGFTGQGSSYQLIVRRDVPDGPIIHEGPVVEVGNAWNATNREPIEITEALTEEDLQRGYIDVYVSARVEGDGWTLYRHNPGRREITALVVEATPELQRMTRTLEAMRERQIALIPLPRDAEFADGNLLLTGDSRIALGPLTDDRDRFAAEDLAAQIEERTGLALEIVEGGARPADILLERVQTFAAEPQGAYHLSVSENARVTASTASGLFYGAQTLAQLVDPDGAIPRVEISDEPAYPLRGLQYDVARGQTVPMEWWKRLIRELARCKLNMLVIYGENDYAFEAYPFLGREGTFTPEKARELSDYARQYHVQLVPQFESLGHASAVLRHEELADLREAGHTWVFCTTNPDTWMFLDTVYGELARQFPHSQYIHVGGDEFETHFGRCEQCRAFIAEHGRNALYAEHMNRLNALCEKYDREMLFWPSHEGWTLESIDLLDTDCIPTEWIYHGPATYPQIEQYREAGFTDVWPSPAVVCFSRIWPDYRTTFRGIRGFLQAGAEEGCGGCMTTTWEWQHGSIVTNSLPGMLYAAECAWSLGRAPVSDYERRYAGHWLGLRGGDAGERLHDALIEPWPREGPTAICYAGERITELWWAAPKAALREYAAKDPRLMEAAPAIVETSEAALERLERLRADAIRNEDLLAHARLALMMYREAGHKLVALDQARADYQAAADALPADRAAAADGLEACSLRVRSLAEPLAEIGAGLEDAAEQVGAAMRDVRRTEQLHADVVALADELQVLAREVRAGKRDALPAGTRFGFITGRLVKVGTWRPAQMSEDGTTLRYDVTEHISRAGEFSVEWDYTDGAHALTIHSTSLVVDGEVVAADEHAGQTGVRDLRNVYHLALEEYDAGATCEVAGEVASRGGTDSAGDVWLIVDDGE